LTEEDLPVDTAWKEDMRKTVTIMEELVMDFIKSRNMDDETGIQ
jgi:hypothetical protein